MTMTVRIPLRTTKANAEKIRRAAQKKKISITRYLHWALGLEFKESRGGRRSGAGRPKRDDVFWIPRLEAVIRESATIGKDEGTKAEAASAANANRKAAKAKGQARG